MVDSDAQAMLDFWVPIYGLRNGWSENTQYHGLKVKILTGEYFSRDISNDCV